MFVAWFVALAINGLLNLEPESLPAAPFDLAAGTQAVPLRMPLIARTRGVRMVLYVRKAVPAEFERSNPPGTVEAHLVADDGSTLTLRHTGYDYYRGLAGLVLTEADAEEARRGQRFDRVEFASREPLRGVRMVWLDRLARRVQDLETTL